MSNVTALPGAKIPTNAPNTALVSLLRDVLAKAESGELQSLVGVGFVASGHMAMIMGDTHPNVYEMHGAVACLQNELFKRHP